MSDKKSVVIHGPQGCGKSINANELMMAHNCDTLQDDWDGNSDLNPGTLALTNVSPPYKGAVDVVVPFNVQVVH